MLNHRGHVFACLCQATMPRDHDLTWGQRKCFMQTSQACRTAHFYRDYFQSLHFVILCKKLLYKYAKQGIFFGSSLCPASVLRECYTNHSGSLLSYQCNSGPCTTVVRTIPCHTILCTVVPCGTINSIPRTTIIHAISPHLPCITQFAEGFCS